MTKDDLAEKITRRLGAPMVKVELDRSQIFDAIDYAKANFLKWAIGQSTVERYYTMMLSGGQAIYYLPTYVTDVLSYDMRVTGSIHTLFTVENFLYNQGMYEFLFMQPGQNQYTILSYHIAREFLDTVRRYIFSSYNYIYHRYTNQLEIIPTPPSGSVMSFTISGANVTYDSPGFILLRTMVLEGDDNNNYDTLWILDYATAVCKTYLGRVRSKFANFTAVGSNVGLAMDGETLLAEGKEEIQLLEERLRTEEVWDMTGDIIIG
jgi:hypothetical protein